LEKNSFQQSPQLQRDNEIAQSVDHYLTDLHEARSNIANTHRCTHEWGIPTVSTCRDHPETIPRLGHDCGIYDERVSCPFELVAPQHLQLSGSHELLFE